MELFAALCMKLFLIATTSDDIRADVKREFRRIFVQLKNPVYNLIILPSRLHHGKISL